MINSELSEISYVIQAGVTTYPIGFEYHFNENNSPQLLVKIGESVAIINVDFQLSADESEIILIPTEEEAKAQTSPNDTRWMDRIVGKELLITRDIPFVQTSDYTVGRISPEQIEYDFDRTVMRDQEILHKLNDFTVDVALAESLANAAVETANEAATAANQATATANTALETANNAIVTANDAKAVATQASKDAVDAIADSANAVNKAEAADMTATTAMEIAAEAVTVAQGAEAAVANKQDKLTAGTNVSIVGTTINVDGYSKAQVDNKVTIIEADVDANADAIQKTRADFISADSDIHTILNNHAGELTTLHNDVDAVGDQISGIEEKIPGTASASNPLVTKQQLLDEEMDIREDLNSGLSELQTQVTAQAAEIAKKQDELTAGENITIVDGVISATGGSAGIIDVSHDDTLTGSGTVESPLGVAKNLSVEELTVSTDEGTLSLSITAGTATIATNNGLDIAAQTKFDSAPTTDDTTAWADANPTALVTKQQVVSAISEGGGASGDYLPLSGGILTGKITRDIGTRTGTSSRYDKIFDFSGSVDAWGDGSLTYSKLNAEYSLKWSGAEEIRFLHGENSNYGISIYFSNDVFSISPVINTESAIGMNKTLGKKGQWWDAIYTEYIHAPISSGSSDDYTITVPRKKGTMATIEDIAAIGGEGTTGQVLTKTDDGFAWQDSTGGGGSAEYPDQTDNAGKFLQTDGATVKWADALINNSTDLGVLSVGYGATATGSTATAFGANTQATGNSSVAVGPNASATETRTTSIGTLAQATQLLSNALGAQSKALAYNATQIGSGTNETDGSLQFRSYQLVSDDGTIPTDRYTTTPTGAGTYVPKLTIAEDGTATREWGAESAGGGASGDYLPLSGGTLTGQVSIDIGETSGYTWTDYPVLLFNWTNPDAWADYTGTGFFATANGLSFGKKGASTPLVTLDTLNKIIYPGIVYNESLDSGINIGTRYSKFRSIAVAKINTGENTETFEETFIEVPKNKTGTMVVATPPTDNGTYVLKATVVDGTITTEWVLES